ncbi:MAG: DNA polymerase III subunit beta [Pseudomonadota bacterium]
MKISTKREDLLEPLQKIGNVVERRQTLPILANILINAGNGIINLTATDLEVELKTQAIATCDDEHDFTLPARKILDICKALPEGADISMEVTNDKVHIKSGRSRFSLGILPAQDYPVIEASPGNSFFTIKENDFKKLIDKTAFAMAQQDVRYYLNGMLLEIEENIIRTVATDGHRLALCEIPTNPNDALNNQVILPRKAVLELSKLLNDKDSDIKIELSNSYIKVLLTNSVFTSKLIDGRFPEYQRVMPSSADKELEADKDKLKQSLTRASILSNEKYRGIRFSVINGTLQLQAHNPEQEEAEEELEVIYNGEDIKIGFNVGYLIDALSAISEDIIIIELKDSNSSALIYGKGNSSSKYVVMPMRI